MRVASLRRQTDLRVGVGEARRALGAAARLHAVNAVRAPIVPTSGPSGRRLCRLLDHSIGLAWRALGRKQSDRPGSLIILGDAESRDGAKRRLPRREQRELFVDLHATLTVHKSTDNASAPIEGRTVSNWTRASTRSSTPRLVLQKAYATWSAADAHARVRTVRDTANTPAAQTNHSLVGGRLRRVQYPRCGSRPAPKPVGCPSRSSCSLSDLSRM